jgi:hypothetical protein
MAYFYNMYKQQDDSMKTFASKRDNLRVLGVQLMSSISEDFDTSFIEEALNELKDCRLALKYSFVWAFYQRKKHKRTVYEFLQVRCLDSTKKQEKSNLFIREIWIW